MAHVSINQKEPIHNIFIIFIYFYKWTLNVYLPIFKNMRFLT